MKVGWKDGVSSASPLDKVLQRDSDLKYFAQDRG